MNAVPIHFFQEDIAFDLPEKERYTDWIKEVILKQGATLEELNYIFCSDEYLHKINLDYLQHDTLTDIITFDNSDADGMIEGDIFISVERVRENAIELSTTFESELARVIIHGVLHLLGFQDKSEEQAAEMREKEDLCLSLLQ
jgi:rRNA maturation RNase YbeY